MRKLLPRLALLLVATAVALLLAEGVARLALPPPQVVVVEPAVGLDARLDAERDAAAEITLERHPEQGGLYVETPTGRRLRASTRAVIERHALSERRIEIHTNSIGYRNPEIGPPRGRRLLFLGDSITFADYLPEEQTFVRRVEVLARDAGRDWETINAGVGGVSLETELAILVESGLALAPDVVVLGFYLNDFHDSRGVRVPRLPPLLRRSTLAYHGALAWQRWRGADAGAAGWADDEQHHIDFDRWADDFAAGKTFDKGDFTVDRSTLDAFIAYHFTDWGGAWSPHAWDYMRPSFEELARLSRVHGFALRIVAFPVRHQVETEYDASYPQQQLAAIADELDVPLLDTLPLLRELYVHGDEPLFFDHCHHTAFASERIAASIHEFLAALDATE